MSDAALYVIILVSAVLAWSLLEHLTSSRPGVIIKRTCIDRQSSPAPPASVPEASPPTPFGVEQPPLRHYVLLNQAAPPGFQAAQCIHASGESVALAQRLGRELPADGCHAYALHCLDEADLLARARRLTARGVPHVVIREPDAPYHGQVTAIGIVPMRDTAAIRSITSDLPLAFKNISLVRV